MKKIWAAVASMAVLASACGPGSEILRNAIDAGRNNAGVGEAWDSPYLDIQALLESVNACNRANGGTAPAPTLAGQTSAETAYVTRTSPIADDELAAQDIIDNLPAGAAAGLTQAKWDRQGIATYRCPDDGLLYGTGIMSDFVAAPATGRYVEEIFTEAQITVHDGLRYGTAPLCEPTGNDLLLDIYEPTVDTVSERPVMVVIHGGGFKSGDRKKFAAQAMDYAQQGFVAVAIEYRTCPSGFADEAAQATAVINAIDDGIESLRWINANAATYDMDTSRIGVVGSSAGAWLAYGAALLDDPTPGGPLAGQPYQPHAVMGSAGHLTPVIDLLGFVPDAPPVMMFRAEFDTVAGPGGVAYEWEYAYQTCNAIHAQDGICDFFMVPGPGHVFGIGPNNQFADWYVPFFYEHLDLMAN